MATQEQELNVHYRSGGKNQNADALLHDPVIALLTSASIPNAGTRMVPLATVQTEEKSALARDNSPEERRQRSRASSSHPVFGELEFYLRRAREITLTHSQYKIVDNVLHHTEEDKTLRVISVISDWKSLFNEVHSGTMDGHLWCAKTHGQLVKHHWWPQIRADISSWCRGCLTCATCHVNCQAVKPPLSPILVEGPFHRIGVDVF